MRSQKWYKGLAITMVVGGIGGEGLFEYLAARAEDRVRRFDEKLTEVAQASALDALKNARDAQEQTKREIDARLVLEKQLIARGPRWRMLEARKGPFIEVLRKYKYQPVTIMECGAWGSITPERFRIEQDLVNFLGTTVLMVLKSSALAGRSDTLAGTDARHQDRRCWWNRGVRQQYGVCGCHYSGDSAGA